MKKNTDLRRKHPRQKTIYSERNLIHKVHVSVLRVAAGPDVWETHCIQIKQG